MIVLYGYQFFIIDAIFLQNFESVLEISFLFYELYESRLLYIKIIQSVGRNLILDLIL